MIKIIRIPEERIAVLIGPRGLTKKYIARKTCTKIRIEGDVEVSGEAVNVMTAGGIITAIGRGFSPENALLLLNEENALDVVDLPKNERELLRVRSRLIGTGGKCRRNLEQLTKTKISVYGKTVGIIGRYHNVELAKDGIRRLVKGFAHRAVYEYLEGKQAEILKEVPNAD
jgi:ribosomal RNA assembly protein